MSPLALVILLFLPVFDDDDMETPRAVGAQHDPLLDIARARRPGDEIDDPRQRPIGAQTIPTVLIGSDDLVGTDHGDMGIGQKIQSRRRLWP